MSSTGVCADMAGLQDRPEPSAVAVAVGTALVSLVVGYYIGQAQSIGVFGRASSPHPAALDDEESDDASDAEPQSGGARQLGELQRFAGNSEECKLVLVTRTDLGMTKGKCGQQLSPSSATHPQSPVGGCIIQELWVSRTPKR